MNFIRQFFRTQPAAIAAAVRFVLGAAVTFGLVQLPQVDIDFYAAQGFALWAAIQGIIELLVTTWTHGQVAPKATFEPLADEVVSKTDASEVAKRAAYRALPRSGTRRR